MKPNTVHDHRVSPKHLEREALVYVRQSSPYQVRTNVESTRVQIGLREKAIALGWKNPAVIEDDLGISADGFSDRPGFQSMLARVAVQAVGIILCVDASRLSRNSKDWASLFELCGYFNTLVSDLDQVYDLSIPNDRLVIGIKGTVAELELSTIKMRLRMGAEAKAARGELKFIVPPGYTHDQAGRIVFDPDRRVREAIAAMFDQFDRCKSIRQLAMRYRDTQTLFPIRKVRKTRTTAWEIPTPEALRKLLKHPIYSGTYVYGRRNERVEYVDGKLVKRTGNYLPLDQCRVCIRDNHPACIPWERFQANLDKIAESRPRWKMLENRGPIRDGLALLPGLLRCAHCGSKIHVAYKSHSALYYCDGEHVTGSRSCLSFGSKLIDQNIGDELCRALSPLAVGASCLAMERRNQEQTQAIEQARLQVEAAQYEADRAFEQFDLVDPRNRLVADSLEERLNQKLSELQAARLRLDQLAAAEKSLSEEQIGRIEKLARDFPKLWSHPKAEPALKKRLLRAAIHEIMVEHQSEHQRLEVTIHWQGGVHTQLHVKKRATPIGSKTDPSLIDTVRSLASLSDAEIARIFNMKKITTPRGLRWTEVRVRGFRKHHHIRSTRLPEDEDYMTGQEVAEQLGISRHGVMGLIRIGALHNHQITDFAPWRILRAEVESESVKKLVRVLKKTGRLPKTGGCSETQLSISLGKSGKG